VGTKGRLLLWLLYCILVLLPQIPLFDPVVDEVPGEGLPFPFFPVHPKIRVDIGTLQGRTPVPMSLMDTEEDIPHPAVTHGKEGLHIPPLGEVVDHAGPGDLPHALFDGLDLLFQSLYLFEWLPLERRPCLGHKGGDAQDNLPDPPPPLSHVMFDPFNKGADPLDILRGLGGEADDKVELEVRDAVGGKVLGSGENLFILQPLCHNGP